MTLARLFRFIALGLILVVAPPPARAQQPAEDLAALVSGLAADGFAAKEQAIVALGKLGDARAVPILQALSDDRLRQAPDGRVVLLTTDGARMTDALSGQELRGIAPDSLDRIIVNNRLRGAIEAALGALTLFSPDPAARLAAARD